MKAYELSQIVEEWKEQARKYRKANRKGQYEMAMQEVRKWEAKLEELINSREAA